MRNLVIYKLLANQKLLINKNQLIKLQQNVLFKSNCTRLVILQSKNIY